MNGPLTNETLGNVKYIVVFYSIKSLYSQFVEYQGRLFNTRLTNAKHVLKLNLCFSLSISICLFTS
jgi:hypothetical protein